MLTFDEAHYRLFFHRLTGFEPYDYQIRTARLLCEGKNLALRIPTGAGKTWAILAPFLYSRHGGGPTRLIYALPLRTLAHGIFEMAKKAAQSEGLPIDPQVDKRGREIVSPAVTLQTGEQPDDPFFTRGTVIVTTYDQILSGLLGSPYGLAGKLHNINAASIMGSLVVFDEFHLMSPQRAFLTAVAGSKLFQKLAQSVWMTATATSPLLDTLRDALNCEPISLKPNELASLPSISTTERRLVNERKTMAVAEILQFTEGRSIVLFNTVGRAQQMFRELKGALQERSLDLPLMLLHSRFFKKHRREKEEELRSRFGPGSKKPAILVATQVVEAGLDISCEHLHTELCPMNALAQRAGRCARFPEERGVVHVYELPQVERAWLPYGDLTKEDNVLTRTREVLKGLKDVIINPDVISDWVEQVHKKEDSVSLQPTWRRRLEECLKRIERNALVNDAVGVADLIRGDDTERVSVIVAEEASLPARPVEREGMSLSRWSLTRLLTSGQQSPGWFWDLSSEIASWRPLQNRDDIRNTYSVCLKTGVAAYDQYLGLRLGERGEQGSPLRTPPPRPGHEPLHAEPWVEHAKNVGEECQRRFDAEFPLLSVFVAGMRTRFGLARENLAALVQLAGFLHDLGKLNQPWQQWAEAAQRMADPSKLALLPLAHTDYDYDSPEDRDRAIALKASGLHRPPHAAHSAYLIRAWHGNFLGGLPLDVRTKAISACASAIIAHHGGWLPAEIQFSQLADRWDHGIKEKLGLSVPEQNIPSILRVADKDKSREVKKLLDYTTHPDELSKWWPLVSYLTRTLRLSDQRSTAEGGDG